LFFNSWLISKWDRRSQSASKLSDVRREHKISPSSQISRQRLDWVKPWGLAFGFLITIASLLTFYDRGPVPIGKSLGAFPSEFGEWVEGSLEGQSPPVNIDGADVEIFKSYNNGEDHKVFLYVAYLESQRQGKEVVNYRLNPLYQAAVSISIDSPGELPNRVNLTKILDRDQILRVVFWYDLNGRIASGRGEAKLYTIWDALRRGNTNGALIMVYEKTSGEETAGKIPQSLKDFVSKLLAFLKNYLPH
jgi:EpsI family protein